MEVAVARGLDPLADHLRDEVSSGRLPATGNLMPLPAAADPVWDLLGRNESPREHDHLNKLSYTDEVLRATASPTRTGPRWA